MRRTNLLVVLIVLGLLGALAAKSWLVPLPDVRPMPGASEFNVHRAAGRLTDLISEEVPHPADTPANDVVRGRLVAHLAGMGLQPQIRDALACNELEKARGVTCARVRNVVVTIGPARGSHLLLNAHYDSSVAGPGAGDDGAGVATLLEVASILKDEPLRRPVTFLFNEGEELGLLGARAFLEQDPIAARVDSLINLEARGTTGLVNMFETSLPNGAPITVYSRAVEQPVASSLATDLYRQLPNYTDVNSFAERGWMTLNLAMAGNETRYHSPGDNLRALDPRSLQHMGDQTLALARELVRGVPEPRVQRIFMDLLGVELVSFPQVLGLVALAILIAGLAWVGWRRRIFGLPTFVAVAALLSGTLLAWAGEALVGLLRPGMFWRAYPLWTHLAVYGSTIAGTLIVLATLGRRLEVQRLRIAHWLLFLLIGGAVAFIAPGGIIYFLLPPIPVLAVALAGRRVRGTERLASLTAVLLLFVTFGVMLAQVEELLNAGPMWLFAPLGGLMLLPVLIEAKPLLDRVPAARLIGGSAALLLGGWSIAAAAPAYSNDRQQQFTIEHVTDWQTGRSYWSVLNDFAPLPASFESAGKWSLETLPQSKRKRWLTMAPKDGALPAPALHLAGGGAVPGGRRVTVRLQPNGAQSVAIIAPEDAAIRAAGTAGYVRRINPSVRDGTYVLRCFGRSCDGMIMDIIIGKAEPVEVILLGSRPGLPGSAQPLIGARPNQARPQYAPDATHALARVRL